MDQERHSYFFQEGALPRQGRSFLACLAHRYLRSRISGRKSHSSTTLSRALSLVATLAFLFFLLDHSTFFASYPYSTNPDLQPLPALAKDFLLESSPSNYTNYSPSLGVSYSYHQSSFFSLNFSRSYRSSLIAKRFYRF